MFVPGIQRRRVTEANTTARPGGRGASFRLLPLSAAILALLAGPARAEQAVQLGEINVKGSIIDDRFGDDAGSPTSTTSLSGRQIEEQHLENLIDALRAVPGVTADTQGGDDLKIKMRGVENQRYMGEKPGVAIIIDGVPVFERTGKVNIDLDNIQSLKVIKGGASYLFGEDALAGAVVITTKRGAGNKGVRAEYERGSFGYERRLLRAGFASDMLVGHLQYNLREAEGYHFQSNYSLESLSGNLRWLIDDSSDLSFGFETADRFRDKHGTVTGVTQAAEDPRGTVGKDYSRHYDISLERYNLTYSKDFSAQTNLLALLYEYSDHTVFWSGPSCYLLNAATGRYTANCRDINDAYTTLNDYQQTQRGLKTELRSGDEGFGWMGGLEFRRNQYLNLTTAMVDYAMRPQTGATPPPLTLTGAVGTDDDTREAANAAYTEFRWMPHADWTLTGNLRHDRINLNYDNVSPLVGETKRFSASSWRLGGAWQASPATSWFGNVSTGFRTPTVEQLYRGTLSPTGGVANNTDLTPERAVNYELGMRSRSTLLGWDASVEGALFLIDRTDFILDSNGQYAGSNGTFVGRYENIGGARSRGLELSVKAQPRGGLGWDMAYTYLDAYFTRYDQFLLGLGNTRGSQVGSTAACTIGNPAFSWNSCYDFVAYNNTGNQVPRTPPHTLNLSVNWSPLQAWRFGLEADYRSSSWADEINVNRWPGRTVFNAQADYRTKLPWKDGRISAFLRLENLFDRKYYTIARGTNDAQSYATGKLYDGVYNAEDMSITVNPGRVWRAGLSVSF